MAELTSPRFKGNRRLEVAANNRPVIKNGERDTAAVRILQEALLDLGFRMPLSSIIVPLARSSRAVRAQPPDSFDEGWHHGVSVLPTGSG